MYDNGDLGLYLSAPFLKFAKLQLYFYFWVCL